MSMSICDLILKLTTALTHFAHTAERLNAKDNSPAFIYQLYATHSYLMPFYMTQATFTLRFNKYILVIAFLWNILKANIVQ